MAIWQFLENFRTTQSHPQASVARNLVCSLLFNDRLSKAGLSVIRWLDFLKYLPTWPFTAMKICLIA